MVASSLLTAALLALVAAPQLLLPVPAAAQNSTRTYTRTVQRAPGVTNVTITGDGGRSGTRQTTYGGGSSTSTLTGPGGRTTTVSTQRN